jgi:hypothetical protein
MASSLPCRVARLRGLALARTSREKTGRDHMLFWDWFILLFIFIPLIIAWIYTTIDIFQRPDIGGLAKFLWLMLILFLPILGMLIYFIARPDEYLVE